jgi:hypothetical protein
MFLPSAFEVELLLITTESNAPWGWLTSERRACA